MSDIQIKGVLIPHDEYKRLSEMEDDLHKARMAKSIVVYMGEGRVSVQYNSEQEHVTYLGDALKELTEKSKIVADQKQEIEALRKKTYSWGFLEYALFITWAAAWGALVLKKIYQ